MLYNKDQEVFSWTFLVSVLLSASVKRCFVSRMHDLDFFLHIETFRVSHMRNFKKSRRGTLLIFSAGFSQT